MSNKLPLSLEFFPPKTPEGVAKLASVRQQLYGLKPDFCSVTYGAGGGTQDGTLATVRAIQRARGPQTRASPDQTIKIRTRGCTAPNSPFCEYIHNVSNP